MTGAEQLIEIGRREGKLEGELEGKLEGERLLLKRQLSLRFGAALSSLYVNIIDRADSETLLSWGDRILTAQTIEEVFETI